MSEERGLYDKYNTPKGSFLLKPEQDSVALEALIRYAELTDNVYLHDDLWRWIERIRSGDSE